MVLIRMGVLGSDLAILADAPIPSRTGICRSIMARSGLDSIAICTASMPLDASAQTFQSLEWDSRTFLRTDRTDEESSAIKIRAGMWTDKLDIFQATMLPKHSFCRISYRTAKEILCLRYKTLTTFQLRLFLTKPSDATIARAKSLLVSGSRTYRT